MKKQKTKPSGPAIFMYCVIALCAIAATVCFYLYYSRTINHNAVLWTGITCFTIMYHLWLRIIMGNVTKLLKIEYTMPFFKERSFEKKLYRFFKVKSWKDKALTYNPELFSLKDYSLSQVANTMCKAETDHLVNVAISLSTLLFALIWGQLPIFLITAVFAILFDMQFVLIQRYNRPRIVRLIERKNERAQR
ncbi:MAG: hypothetical protein IJE16_01705 [Ruminococcus sp.]|nr:hypothetical protein [Ruminococcus sp.]